MGAVNYLTRSSSKHASLGRENSPEIARKLDVYQTQTLILLRGYFTQGTQSIVHPTAPLGAMTLRLLRFRAEFSPRVLGKESVSLQLKRE